MITIKFEQQDLKQIIRKIVAYNNCWHSLRDTFNIEKESRLNDEKINQIYDKNLKILRNLKARLQVKLLRKGSGIAYLVKESEENMLKFGYQEPLYSVKLAKKLLIDDQIRTDACHIPVRLINKMLTQQELQDFIKD